ncbi:MAG: hypothetical protein PUF31_02500, partial [Oscillospiraceae bacterium]|nr:hypothetical protein [Oscillospiraceae bacterium]
NFKKGTIHPIKTPITIGSITFRCQHFNINFNYFLISAFCIGREFHFCADLPFGVINKKFSDDR